MNTERVLATVVTCEPSPSRCHNLQAVCTQADQVVVVDNGSSNWANVAAEATDGVLIRSVSNRGAAAAPNEGVQPRWPVASLAPYHRNQSAICRRPPTFEPQWAVKLRAMFVGLRASMRRRFSLRP